MTAWWKVLGLPKDASFEEATAAYRRLAQQVHPDHWACADKQSRAAAEKRMKALNKAYEQAKSAAKAESSKPAAGPPPPRPQPRPTPQAGDATMGVGGSRSPPPRPPVTDWPRSRRPRAIQGWLVGLISATVFLIVVAAALIVGNQFSRGAAFRAKSSGGDHTAAGLHASGVNNERQTQQQPAGPPVLEPSRTGPAVVAPAWPAFRANGQSVDASVTPGEAMFLEIGEGRWGGKAPGEAWKGMPACDHIPGPYSDFGKGFAKILAGEWGAQPDRRAGVAPENEERRVSLGSDAAKALAERLKAKGLPINRMYNAPTRDDTRWVLRFQGENLKHGVGYVHIIPYGSPDTASIMCNAPVNRDIFRDREYDSFVHGSFAILGDADCVQMVRKTLRESR